MFVQFFIVPSEQPKFRSPPSAAPPADHANGNGAHSLDAAGNEEEVAFQAVGTEGGESIVRGTFARATTSGRPVPNARPAARRRRRPRSRGEPVSCADRSRLDTADMTAPRRSESGTVAASSSATSSSQSIAR